MKIENDTCDINEIKRLIPHRFPFLLIDKVINIVENSEATGLKNVTINEPFFQGHFPAAPIVPGVLQIESLAQTAAVLVAKSMDLKDSGSLVYLTTIESAKFRQLVVPGDTMQLKIAVKRIRQKIWKFSGEVYVQDKKKSECEFTAMMQR
jgi:3-hydroxyacyl-[acyl-carrier-protein] dehydratase